MTRLGLLPEQTFAENFKQLRRDIEAIKNAQRVGRDILKPKIIQCYDADGNPTTYDLVATPEVVFGNTQVREDFVIRFLADSQSQPWGVPQFKLMWGNPDTPASTGQTYGFTYPYLEDFEDSPGKVSYWGYFGNDILDDTTAVYIKVYFYATDTGTLTVTAESTI